MKYTRYLMVFALLGICLAVAPNAHAQRVVVGVGVGPGYVGPAPVCAYGYYPSYPYACAPYGYYGPSWFSGGVFIGAGPWFHGGFYGRPGYWGHGYWGHDGDWGHRGDWDHDGHGRNWGHDGHGFDGHGEVRGSFHGGGSNFHGGGGGFHGGGGHGGGHR
jgi:hypothetical protein